MTIKTTVAALALILAPSLALAYCNDKGQTAASCAAGAVWDEAKGACVIIPSS